MSSVEDSDRMQEGPIRGTTQAGVTEEKDGTKCVEQLDCTGLTRERECRCTFACSSGAEKRKKGSDSMRFVRKTRR